MRKIHLHLHLHLFLIRKGSKSISRLPCMFVDLDKVNIKIKQNIYEIAHVFLKNHKYTFIFSVYAFTRAKKLIRRGKKLTLNTILMRGIPAVELKTNEHGRVDSAATLGVGIPTPSR